MKKLYELKISKDIKINNELVWLPAPNYIYVKVNNQYNIGDSVFKDDIIGEFTCSVSGQIVGIEYKKINGKVEECFQIANNFREERKVISKINKNFNKLDKEKIIDKLKARNLDYLVEKISKNSDVLIINAVDEKLYEYNNIFRIKNSQDDFLENLDVIKNILNVKEVVIVFKESNEVGIKKFLSQIGMYSDIHIKLLTNKYLNGSVYFLDNFKYDNPIVLSSEDIFNIIENIKKNKRITDKIISVYNDITKEITIKSVKLNIPLIELFEGEKIDFSCIDIYVNGYMCGNKENNPTEIILTNNITNIVITSKDSIKVEECIKCGACNNICPKNINVKKYYESSVSNDKCTNCGLCNYICPVNINLRQVLAGEQNDK